jgi:hypothetical protein
VDPDACIQLAINALTDRDIRAYHQALKDYRAWTSRGGFPASPRQLARLRAAQRAVGVA